MCAEYNVVGKNVDITAMNLNQFETMLCCVIDKYKCLTTAFEL